MKKLDVTKIEEKKEAMKSRDFLYWMQSLFELAFAQTLSKKQVAIIQEHLKIAERDHEFIIWLEGLLVTQKNGVNKEFTEEIRTQLQKAFKKVTPAVPSKLLQDILMPRVERNPFDKDWPLKNFDIIC